jgi:hypothetical protein
MKREATTRARARRPKVPKPAETSVLLASGRRCALCFGLYGDASVKPGQIAHLDRNPHNNAPDNLAFLCLPHHDQYDSKSRQSKGLTPDEVKAYRVHLREFVKAEGAPSWGDSPDTAVATRGRGGGGSSLAAYDRRIKAYVAARELLGSIIRNGRVTREEVWKFAADTDDVLFLFDDNTAQFYGELYRHALQLAALESVLEGVPVGDQRSKWVDQMQELLLWFTAQLGVLRQAVKPHLRLRPDA